MIRFELIESRIESIANDKIGFFFFFFFQKPNEQVHKRW